MRHGTGRTVEILLERILTTFSPAADSQVQEDEVPPTPAVPDVPPNPASVGAMPFSPSVTPSVEVSGQKKPR
jgi:hypothetical protein